MTQNAWGTGEIVEDVEAPEGSWRPVKVLVGILVALVVVGGAAAYYFFAYRAPHAAEVAIGGTVPAQIFGGEPFDLAVNVVNASAVVVKDATLVIVMPDGIDIVGSAPGTRSVSIPLDPLQPRAEITKTVNLVAHGDPNSVRNVQAVLQYATPESGTHTFRASKDIQILLGAPAVSLAVDGPQYVAAGSDFVVSLHYKNNLTHLMPPSSITVAYPATYTFGSAQAAPNESNNKWNLPALQPGGEGTIQIHGSVAAGRSDIFPFLAQLKTGTSSQEYLVTQQTFTTQLLPSPLSITVTADGKQDAIVSIGNSVSYSITVKNISNFPIQNLVVTSKLASPLFDGSSVGSQGTFSSLNRTVTWNVASTPDLRTLSPGDEATVNFNVNLVKNFPLKSVSDKNFSAAVETNVSSPTVPANAALDRIMASTISTVKIAGTLAMDAQAYWKEPTASIVNKGPYPPRIDQSTQYTIHWVIRTQGADMKNVHLIGSLQSGATWTGVVKSNQSTKPIYNTQTGEVTWDIPLLPANRGSLGTPAAEAVFQIQQTPSANQGGREVELFSSSVLTATDVFTSQQVTDKDNNLTTALPDDNAAPRSGAVIQ